ncbi:hypothetical protein MA16_Dca024534 [Dendrobium catenatum]|uniref:Uncharacterized protein n=1 Tax=Dendrobium catenatum TaxID=906689 RepID=A0A2I0VNA9_9ASPA|nr:hypothetical protein MA16_Dca024534 [Dendrobium catenatum]
MAEKADGLYTSVSSSYLPPNEPLMGPVMYPPASLDQKKVPFPSFSQFQNYRPKFSNFKRTYQHNTWTLPSAHKNQGVLLILPDDFSLYDDVISRWESITLNLLNDKKFLDNKVKVLFIENLLGEHEKKVWIQWRMAYENEYVALVNITDDL